MNRTSHKSVCQPSPIPISVDLFPRRQQEVIWVVGLIQEAVTLGILTPTKEDPLQFGSNGRPVLEQLRHRRFTMTKEQIREALLYLQEETGLPIVDKSLDFNLFITLLMKVQDGSALKWCLENPDR